MLYVIPCSKVIILYSRAYNFLNKVMLNIIMINSDFCGQLSGYYSMTSQCLPEQWEAWRLTMYIHPNINKVNRL